MYEELIEALRLCVKYRKADDALVNAEIAANAIEELQKDLGRSKEYEAFWEKEANEALKKFQVAVASKPRWIPVTERLPEDRHDVLVYAGVLFPYITVGYYDGLWKFSFNDEEIAGSADYWMPLPPKPKEKPDEL